MDRRRKRQRSRQSNNMHMYLLLAAGVVTGMVMFSVVNMNTGTENGITNKTWESIEPVIASRLGDDYDEAGQCTGYVYWCLDEAYGVDYGENSYVDELENKLQNAGISKVAKGRTGKITQDMQPGDIVFFLDGRRRTHCAILGEQGCLYHAISTGVTNSFTLYEWMVLPYSSRNCDRYIIYRGVTSK